MLQKVSQGTFDSVTVADIRTHLNIIDTSTDAYLQDLIDLAQFHCERFTGLDFCTTQWKLILDQFPVWGNYNWQDRYGNYIYTWPWVSEFAIGRVTQMWQRVYLSRGPMQSIQSIVYYDTANTAQTILPNDANYPYITVNESYMEGYVEPNLYWPIAYPRPDAVTISFTSGFNDGTNPLPPSAKHAVRLLVGKMWMLREASAYGPQTAAACCDETIECLLWDIKPGSYI